MGENAESAEYKALGLSLTKDILTTTIKPRLRSVDQS
jgi:hypothetical protein